MTGFLDAVGRLRLVGDAGGQHGFVEQLQGLVLAAVERRDALARRAFDVLQVLAFIVGAQRDRDAGLAGARGTADAVDIGFRNVGQLVIDDVADIVDVDAAGGDVGGDQGAQLAGLEGLQGAFTLRLVLVAVDGGGFDAAGLQIGGDLVGRTLGTGEDQRTGQRRVGVHFRQQGALADRLDIDHALFDALGGRGFRRDRHLLGVGQQFAGQDAGFLGHGRREEQVLAFVRQLLRDLADRLDEAQVQHLVGFVKDEELDAAQVDGLLFQVVHQAAGGGDQDVEAAVQRLVLRTVLDAAVDGGDRQAHALGIDLEAVGDLRSQFARRRQDEATHALGGRNDAVGQDVLQDRQGEGRRLAGAGLGDAQQVMAGQQVRNGLGLDRGRGLIAFTLEGHQDRRAQAQIGKTRHAIVFLIHARPNAMRPRSGCRRR